MRNSSLFEKIIASRCGGKVERCHTIPHHGSYNNAAHSWGVAMLMFYLFPDEANKLTIYCLTHDLGEGWVGDIPAPALWANPEAQKSVNWLEEQLLQSMELPSQEELTEDEILKLKSCDRLELYFWCREQKCLGNLFIGDCITAIEQHFYDGNIHPRAFKFFRHIEALPDSAFTPRQQGIIQKLVKVNQQ